MAPLDTFSLIFAHDSKQRLKLLLEEKHLYQKVRLSADDILKTHGDKIFVPQNRKHYEGEIHKALQGALNATAENQKFQTGEVELVLPVTNVKLFCEKCGAREAFRPIETYDVSSLLRIKHQSQSTFGTVNFKISFRTDFQIFLFVFQCQRCEGNPTAFIVKRDGLDLFLEGRSPIEHVELPAFIPKKEIKWFRDAVIAFQSGKVLAALFYLRTFIEQFARRKTGTESDKKTGDEILTAYAGTISENLRSTMPSLREWYDNLSEALHTAKEDEQLFESARKAIEEHFDIRRVHKLDKESAKEKASEPDESSV
jgi:hypothetical protein